MPKFESFTVNTMYCLTVTEYLCHKWPRICSFRRKHNPVLSSFMNYHRVCNKSNTTDGTNWAGTGLPFRSIWVHTLMWWGWYCSVFVFWVVVYRLLLSFFFWSLHCLPSFDLRLLVTPLVASIFYLHILLTTQVYLYMCIYWSELWVAGWTVLKKNLTFFMFKISIKIMKSEGRHFVPMIIDMIQFISFSTISLHG